MDKNTNKIKSHFPSDDAKGCNSWTKNAEILLNFVFPKNILKIKSEVHKCNWTETYVCTVVRPKMWIYCNLLETIMVVRKQFIYYL
jgi:hypothetical protein